MLGHVHHIIPNIVIDKTRISNPYYYQCCVVVCVQPSTIELSSSCRLRTREKYDIKSIINTNNFCSLKSFYQAILFEKLVVIMQ